MGFYEVSILVSKSGLTYRYYPLSLREGSKVAWSAFWELTGQGVEGEA